MFSQALVALLMATAVTAAPAKRAIQPWEITRLNTHSPSGRPGNDPHQLLNVTITDPNILPVQPDVSESTATYPSSSANCSAQWLTVADVPYNVSIPCVSDSVSSTWSFKVLPGSGEDGTSATTDFGLEFSLHDELAIEQTVYHRDFEGSAQFKVGDNLSGQCGGSGVCNWGLKTTPYTIEQTEN